MGRDTPTDHEPLERIEPQVRVCVCLGIREIKVQNKN